MALSDEQNAMLRLLAQGEQGYGDIAALMGLQESEVRAKVVGALAQLEAEGKPAPDVPPPISGGARPAAEVDPPESEPVEEVPEDADEDEADEPAVADAVAPQEPVRRTKPRARKKPQAAEAAERTGKPSASPTRAAAGDRPDRSVAAAGDAPARRAAGARGSNGAPTSAPTGRTITLPTGRGAWQLGGGLVAAIAVIVVVILLVSGGGGGGDSSSTTTENQSTNASAETGAGKEAAGGAKASTQAKLSAVDGSDAEGLAAFGRVEDKLALQVEATGLEPTEEGTNSYTIWLAQSPKRMLPLASIGVKGSGQGANAIAAQFEVPVEVLAYLATGTFDQIAITKTDNERFEAAVNAATKAKTTPAYTGEEVLRGTITGRIVGIARREEEEQKGE